VLEPGAHVIPARARKTAVVEGDRDGAVRGHSEVGLERLGVVGGRVVVDLEWRRPGGAAVERSGRVDVRAAVRTVLVRHVERVHGRVRPRDGLCAHAECLDDPLSECRVPEVGTVTFCTIGVGPCQVRPQSCDAISEMFAFSSCCCLGLLMYGV
jgi:hypothetical protein